MTIQIFMSGTIFGFLLGVFFCYAFLQWAGRQRVRGRQREIDRLAEQFQELFRQIDQDKNHNS